MTKKYCYILALLTLLISLPLQSLAGPYITEGFTRNFDVNITANPNISNSWLDFDAIDDTVTNLSLGGAYSKAVSDSSLFVLKGYFGIEHHQDYDDLDMTSLSINGTYFFQLEQGYLAPIFEFGIAYTQFIYADSENREGSSVIFKLGVSRRINTKLFAYLNYDYVLSDVDNKTYDSQNDYFTLGLEYRLSSKTTLYTDLQFFTGDLVSDANGVDGLFSDSINAKAIVADPIFDCNLGCEYWSYRFEGDGFVSTTGVVFTLSPVLSLDLSARLYDWKGDSGIDSSDWSGMLGLVWRF